MALDVISSAKDVVDRALKSMADKIPNFSDRIESDIGQSLAKNIPDFSHNSLGFDSRNLTAKEVNKATLLNEAIDDITIIKTRNEVLDGSRHPDTGVPFTKKIVEDSDGNLKKGVFPEFDSKFDVVLPNELREASDSDQFQECNKQLKDWVKNNQEDAKKIFTVEQLDDINNGRNPEGYTWHHHEDKGVMQLVDTETHARTGHTGGKSVWGGGAENR